jgi:hypothetical protein
MRMESEAKDETDGALTMVGIAGSAGGGRGEAARRSARLYLREGMKVGVGL